MSINLIVGALYLLNVWLRWPDAAGISGAPMLLSVIAIGLLSISAGLAARWCSCKA